MFTNLGRISPQRSFVKGGKISAQSSWQSTWISWSQSRRSTSSTSGGNLTFRFILKEKCEPWTLELAITGSGRRGPGHLAPAALHLPLQPLQPPAPGSQLSTEHGNQGCWCPVLTNTNIFGPRCRHWRRIGARLPRVKRPSPITAIGFLIRPYIATFPKPWNFRDREAWFPGRNQTASRLKEKGKELVVELQEIASWAQNQKTKLRG